MLRMTAFNDIECLRRIAFTPFSGVCCMKEFDLDFPVRMHGRNDGLLIVTAHNDMVSDTNNHFQGPPTAGLIKHRSQLTAGR
jgi:hypothetical protein